MVLGAVELELWLRVEASTEAMHGVLLFLSGRTYLHERQGDLFRHKGYSRNFLRWGKNTHTHTQLLNVSRTASLNLQEVFSAQTETEGSSQFANLYFK